MATHNSPRDGNRLAVATTNMSIDDIVNGINSGDEKKEIAATHAARQILCGERNPPIDILINANVVPKLIEFLSRVSKPDLQLDSVWALTNIMDNGTPDQTNAVVSAGALAGIIFLLGSPHPVVAKQAVWALCNLANHGPQLRDDLLERGIFKPLLASIQPDNSSTFLRHVTKSLLNYARSDEYPLTLTAIRQLIPALAHLINNNEDEENLAIACWALMYLDDGPSNGRIIEMIDARVVIRLLKLLKHDDEDVLFAALTTIGKIMTVRHVTLDNYFALVVYRLLAELLVHSEMDIVKEAGKIVSNLAAGNPVQIQTLIPKHVVLHMPDVLSEGYFDFDLLFTERPRIPMLTLLCTLLEAKEPKTILVVLDGLAVFLTAAEKMDKLREMNLHVKMCGGLQLFLYLDSQHENTEIHQKSMAIQIRLFFLDDDFLISGHLAAISELLD
ncbi:importin subunit alpha-5-like [Daphnia pulex]|uniref:importin subunit alpha-5-like n=1 Tax=Daphnia pulex TaxID=6669 RepID=UPI001EDF619C|nr:importin subunit alpha-5-like [Daphnia pulex]